MSGAFQRVAQVGVVPVIAIDDAEHALPLADALLEAGLKVVEITFRTKAALVALERIAKARPELLTGAGTVLTPGEVKSAADAGAAFALAPGFDPAIVLASREAGLPFAPGVMTPSDISQALSLGCTQMKFFPAMPAGGPSMLKNVVAPFAHRGLAFIPTGGVTPETMGDWLALPFVSAVGGTWIARSEDMREGRWSEITDKARAALARVEELRG